MRNEKLIDNPKVFISYAWGSDEYQQKVTDFASRLKSDGVAVVYDKWSMDPGNDTYAFMEKCVRDETIHYVLILLDPLYVKKADDRSGGVGTETQIISAKVYNDVEQTKFIPIVFERASDGSVAKPIYLDGLFYIDLTQENYEQEYMKLVRLLYGIRSTPEPPLGKKPSWVDNPPKVSPISISEIQVLKNKTNAQNKDELINDALEKVKNEIERSILAPEALPTSFSDGDAEKIVEYRNSFNRVRDIFLDLLNEILDVENLSDVIADFLTQVKCEIVVQNSNCSVNEDVLKSFLQELFIYVIALLFKKKKYPAVNSLITRTYFDSSNYNVNVATFTDLFYSTSFATINRAKDLLDYPNGEKTYHSGEAALWMENINPIITKLDFVSADLLLCNFRLVFANDYWGWFPKSYPYEGKGRSPFKDFCVRLKSKHELKRIEDLFGTSDVKSIKELLKPINDITENNKNRYRYNDSFNAATLITNIINLEDIGSLN